MFNAPVHQSEAERCLVFFSPFLQPDHRSISSPALWRRISSKYNGSAFYYPAPPSLLCKFLSFRRPPLPPIMLHWTVPSQASSSLDSALIITVVSAADIGSVFTTALKQPLFRRSPLFPPGDFAAKRTLACVLQSAMSMFYMRVCSTLETGILW